MAKTPAQRKREQRQRQAEAATAYGDSVAPFARSPFPAYWVGDIERIETDFIDETLASIGMRLDFSEDADPECDAGHAGDAKNRGALGRAERAVGALLDSATALAGIINRYKVAEIDRALATLAEADLSTPDAKAQAFRDAAALEGLKKLLSKEVRRSVPSTIVLNGDTPAV